MSPDAFCSAKNLLDLLPELEASILPSWVNECCFLVFNSFFCVCQWVSVSFSMRMYWYSCAFHANDEQRERFRGSAGTTLFSYA